MKITEDELRIVNDAMAGLDADGRDAFKTEASRKGGRIAAIVAKMERRELRTDLHTTPRAELAETAFDEEHVRRGIKRGVYDAKMVASLGGPREVAKALAESAARKAAK